MLTSVSSVELEFVAEIAVDAIDGEVLAPVVAPFGAVVALDGEEKLAGGLREAAQPLVVLVGVFGRGREELDDGAVRTLGAEDRAARALVGRAILVDRGKIALEDVVDEVHVLLVVAHVDRALQQGVRDRFRDFGFAAAGDGRRLVAQRAFRTRANEPPGIAGKLLFQANAEARRQHVGGRRANRELMRLAIVLPADEAFAHEEG